MGVDDRIERKFQKEHGSGGDASNDLHVSHRAAPGEDERTLTFIHIDPYVRGDGTVSSNHSGYFTDETVREIIMFLGECIGVEVTIGEVDSVEMALRDL